MKNNKTSQLNIRVSDLQKDRITKMADNAGYKSVSKFLIDNALNEVKINIKNDRRIFIASLSTAIDYFIKMDVIGENKEGKNKFLRDDKVFVPGGRGINLSRVLNAYNIPNLNIHFSSGFTGSHLYKLLDDQGVNQYRIESEIETKINVYAEDSKGKDISLEERTSPLSPFAKEELLAFIEKELVEDDEFVLSGSFAQDDIKFIENVLDKLHEKKVKIYINTSSIRILDIKTKANPELIVLCMRNFLGEVKSKKDIFSEMQKLIDKGYSNVAFVADVNYSLFMTQEEKYLISSNLIDKLTYSGLEDAFIGGYLANIDKPIEEKLKWAGASVKEKAEDKMDIRFDHILKYVDEINIKKD